jgi:asparagine synthase (glutamine-hydrolysing)
MGAIIAVLDKKGKNATKKAVEMLRILNLKKAEVFGLASPSMQEIRKTVDAFKNLNMDLHIVIGQVFSKILSSDKPQTAKLKNAAMFLNGRIYSPNGETFDVEALAKKSRRNCEELAQHLIKEVEGDFTFVIAENTRLAAGRDPSGCRPLYYGENKNLVALASERKALWRIGIEKTESFPPGHSAVADENGFRFKPVKTLVCSAPKKISMQAATEKLQKLLQKSTQKRLLGLKEVVVAFSGGLDSSIIAVLAENAGANVTLLHASLADQPEIQHAKRTAEKLKLPIQVYQYSENDVENVLQNVLRLIEEPDAVKTSIGIPFYWIAEKAAEKGFNVMLAGQGADELFGGYKRYVGSYVQRGIEKTRRAIFNDVVRLYETNLERDFKICNYHGVELRLPFATPEIAEFATALPLKLKLDPMPTTLRKLVLRQVAKNLGLPNFVVNKPKKAIQYTTGVSNALKKIAKRNRSTVKEYLQNLFQSTCKKMVLHE